MSTRPAAPPANRWVQLTLGVVCMMLIANLQYGWTLFVQPIRQAHGWTIAEIQWAFSIFIALETWLTPAGGWLVDTLGARRGPKVAVALGGVMVGIGWTLNAYATSLTLLYLGAVVSGIGAGFIYATCVGGAVKWFPDRRGLAVGLTAAGFGAGAAVTVVPIKMMIESSGYAHTFLVFGIAQGILLFVFAWLLRAPEPGEVPAPASRNVQQSARSYTPGEVLRSPVFWLLYVMFVAVSSSGLMATAQLALIAADFGIDKMLLLGGASVLAVALVVDNIANGAARPFFGWVSDQIGRENTMIIAFSLGGISYLLLGSMGASPWLFVLFAGLIFFTWGEIFSLFPSTCTDAFGPRYATVNTSLLYTAKGTSALLVPFANMIKTASGSWWTVFLVAAVMNFVVVGLALFVLKPMRRAQGRMPVLAGQVAPDAQPVRVIGLAGWSGAGKTTLLRRLIPALVARGVSVSTVKHAHHDFDVDQPGKDSWHHRQAGATEVLVGSARRWALMHELRDEPEPSLGALLARLHPVDLVLVEGFKRSALPKIEVHRAANGKKLLYPDDPVIVALAADPVMDAPIPCVHLDDVEAVARAVLDHATASPPPE